MKIIIILLSINFLSNIHQTNGEGESIIGLWYSENGSDNGIYFEMEFTKNDIHFINRFKKVRTLFEQPFEYQLKNDSIIIKSNFGETLLGRIEIVNPNLIKMNANGNSKNLIRIKEEDIKWSEAVENVDFDQMINFQKRFIEREIKFLKANKKVSDSEIVKIRKEHKEIIENLRKEPKTYGGK